MELEGKIGAAFGIVAFGIILVFSIVQWGWAVGGLVGLGAGIIGGYLVMVIGPAALIALVFCACTVGILKLLGFDG